MVGELAEEYVDSYSGLWHYLDVEHYSGTDEETIADFEVFLQGVS